MARLARVVAAGLPHHLTQRGNRRQQVFFSDADYAAYRRLLRKTGSETTSLHSAPQGDVICHRSRRSFAECRGQRRDDVGIRMWPEPAIR